MRAGHGVTYGANSAVPVAKFAGQAAIPAIVDWYRSRDLTPRLAIADRLLRVTGVAEHANRVLVRDLRAAEPDPSVALSAHPDDAWFRLSQCEIPVDVLTAVVDGELVFGTHENAAVARAAVTDAPDGTRWVGLWTVWVADLDSDAGRALCEALLAWGASRGATRSYLRIRDDNHATTRLARSLGFVLHHRARYVTPTT